MRDVLRATHVALLFAGIGMLVAAGWPQQAQAAGCDGPLLGAAPAHGSILAGAAEDLLRFRIEDAERALVGLTGHPVSGAGAHHLLAMAAFLGGLVSDDDADFDRFVAHADSLNRMLRDSDATCWTAYMRAETELQRAVVAVKREQYVRAAWSGRSAYRQYSRAIRGFPEAAVLYKGMGLMHLGLGALPGTWRRFLSVLGYQGSIERGLAELERAEGGGVLSRDAAALSRGLAMIALGLDPEDGLEILRRTHERHPQSQFFGYLFGYALLELRQAPQAESVLRRYAAQDGDGVHRYIDFTDYYLARSLFVQGKYAEAETFARRYLARHAGRSLLSAANLLLGEVLELQGKRREAEIYYRRVRAHRDFDIDDASQRAAARRLATPLEDLTAELLRLENAFLAGDHSGARSILESLSNRSDLDPDSQLEITFRHARLLHVGGEPDAALAAYEQVIESGSTSDRGWVPWAMLHRAEIHRARDDRNAAVASYRDAVGVRGRYDYRQTLEQHARAGLERLRAEG